MEIKTKNLLIPFVQLADNFAKRFIGLMGKKSLLNGQGMLLMSCNRVHTCFMRFTIDIVYLDQSFKVIDTQTLKSWRIGKKVLGAKHILELGEGEAQKIILGEYICFDLN